MDTLSVDDPLAWWREPAVLSRFVRDVLQSEMASLRPSGWPLPPGGWHANLHWVHDLGADSLELMSMSSALADACGLNDAAGARSLYEDPCVGAWERVACAALERRGAVMRFRSSGSTGAPKACRHRLDALVQEIRAMAAVIGPVQRILTPVRSHHIYGWLFSVLLPRVTSGPAPAVIDLHGQPPAMLGALLRPGDLVVGFPDWWRAVARAMPDWPAGVVGLTSTAPCPAELCAALRSAGLSRLVHVYGSSETSGIGWREGGEPHYTLHPFWQHLPDEPQALDRVHANGERERFALQDAVQWLDAQRFVPGARADGAVQVGGVNLHLQALARQWRSHPQVADVALRLHDFSGQPRLKAFVVPADPQRAQGRAAMLLQSDLQAWARRHLAPPARPADIRIGTALPVNAMGKASDWAVPSLQ